MIERVIYRFACACGHTWQGRKFGGLNGEDLGRCAGCDAPITEAMEAAAEPLGIESDGPDPRAPELLAFGVRVDACTHRFVGVKITNGKPDGLRCTECGSKVGESTLIEPPSSPCARCGGSHPLVAHYGTGVCPSLAKAAAAVDAETDARVTADLMADWHARFDALSAEIDALRDLRALVLRTGHPTGKAWAAIIAAARAAMTPATFDPAHAFTSNGPTSNLCLICGDVDGQGVHRDAPPAPPAPKRETAEAVLRDVWRHWAGGDVPADLEARIRAALGLPPTVPRCTSPGCTEPPEANLERCRAHEGGFVIPIPRSRSTVFPTEEHACSHCHMVTHARVGMGPPATCPGCGR